MTPPPNPKNPMHYRLNEPDVIQETVETETLIVHTRIGTYYSLQGSGTRIWNALLSGDSVDQIADSFDAGDEAQREAIRSGVETFVQTLLGEQLVLPATADPRSAEAVPGRTEAPRPAFVSPQLQRFTDMQELLLVDPIHEVDPEAGWPVQKDPTKPE